MTGKEIVEVPTNAVGLRQEKIGEQEIIQYKDKKVKKSWNLNKYYLSCSGDSAKAKAIRRKLLKIQGKPPKDTVPYGTKQKVIESMVKSTEKANKKANKSTGKDTVNINVFIETFREMTISKKAETLKELKQIYADCVLSE
jgi:hypothetical protein